MGYIGKSITYFQFAHNEKYRSVKARNPRPGDGPLFPTFFTTLMILILKMAYESHCDKNHKSKVFPPGKI